MNIFLQNQRSLMLVYFLTRNSARAFEKSFNLADLNGSNGFVLQSTQQYDSSGRSVTSGDVNDDGIDDIIIGAAGSSYCVNNICYTSDDAGATYVVLGNTAAMEASINLSSLDGYNGFKIKRKTLVVSSGDVNGDGIDDIISSNQGNVAVVFGSAGEFDTPMNGTALDETNGFLFDVSLRYIGDINGDGFGDFLVGGKSVVFGKASGFDPLIDLTTLDGKNGFVFQGSDASAVSAGDVNGDGFGDIILGSPWADARAGVTHVLFGQKHFDPVIDLANLDGNNGFLLKGAGSGHGSGRSVSSGDVNGDGFDDVIIGAMNAHVDSMDYAGQTYVVYGRKEGFESSINLSSLNGNNGFAIQGKTEYDMIGEVVYTGDVNGDGFDDVLIFGIQPYSRPEVHVVFGRSSSSEPSFSLADLDGSNGFSIRGMDWGTSVSSGDVNGDGVDDVIIGCYGGPENMGAPGETYIVFGEGGEGSDADQDGVSDAIDNCPFLSNVGQVDTDGDGEGDACEPIADPFSYVVPVGSIFSLDDVSPCTGYGDSSARWTNSLDEVISSSFDGTESAGLYNVCVTCSNDQATDKECTYVVLYDPLAGFVTGAGLLNSPAGAYKPFPDLAGQARFRFTAKHKKGDSVPEGESYFRIRVGDFTFKSIAFEWLVISGTDKAKLKGEGIVNGVGSYGFMITMQDIGDVG